MKKHLFRAVSLMLLAALCLTLFAGCSPRKATIFTVNGDDVCYDDIMVHLFFQNGFLQEAKIHVVSDGDHVAALLSAQQVSCASNFQIAHGDFEPGAEFGKVADGSQTLLTDF